MKFLDSSTEHNSPDCGWVDERLDAYFDGELSADDCDGVERHLSSCEACDATSKAIGGVRTSLRGLPMLRCPNRVLVAVRSEASKFEVASRRVRERRVRSVAVGSAACLLLAVGVWSVRGAIEKRQEGRRRAQLESDLVELRSTLSRQVTDVSREAFEHGVAKPTRTVVTALESSQLGRWSAQAVGYLRTTTHDGVDAG